MIKSVFAATAALSETEFSAKIGASVAVTESLGIYGELSAITADQDFDDLGVGGKLGVKFAF